MVKKVLIDGLPDGFVSILVLICGSLCMRFYLCPEQGIMMKRSFSATAYWYVCRACVLLYFCCISCISAHMESAHVANTHVANAHVASC